MKKLFLFSISILISCAQPQHHQVKKEVVHSYKTQDANGDWIIWYLLFFNTQSQQQYYYYSSPTPVTNFSNVTFQQSSTIPFDEKVATELPNEEIAVSDFDESLQQDITENPENFEGTTTDEMGDYEGGSDNSSSGESDGGSSDGGSSGGDSGGGDSGGGGSE